MKMYSCLIFLIVFFACKKPNPPIVDPPVAVNTKFTIPVFPDTQETISQVSKLNMFYSQVRWIAQYKDSLHIPIALHVGDLVNFDTTLQFQRASDVMGVLDSAKINYAIALGNHDTEAVLPNGGSAAPGNVNQNLRKTFKFNTYFPVSRFALQKGRYEENKSDNAFQQFEAGGKKWMVVNLEFCARKGAAQWADSIIGAYPNYNTIVITHYHLTPTGQIATGNAGYGDMKVIDIFNTHLKKHKNLLMVLSGHVCYNSSRTDVGDKGNTIYSILQNYQCQDGGGGYLRLLDIDTKAGTITGKMYSPHYNKYLDDAATVSFSDVKFVD